MECLPSDIVLDILSRLPVESVLDCKLVSKRWLNLLIHRWDQFAKMHHQHQLLQIAGSSDAYSSSTGLLFSFQKDEEDRTIGPRLYYGDKYNDEMNIHEKLSYKTLQQTSVRFPHSPLYGWSPLVGSCNGLICLNKFHHGISDPIHICNPNTGEYVNLPEYIFSEEGHYRVAYGFGYVHSVTNDQYKVVRIIYHLNWNNKREVQVYTVGSGSGWRTIGTTCYHLWKHTPLGTYVNGSLHWIDIMSMKIVAFNLEEEEFRLIQPPPCYDHPRNYYGMVLALGGDLCLCYQNNVEHLLVIWSLKKNATEESWSRDFSIAYNSAWKGDYFDYQAIMPLLITKKNEVLFVHRGSTLYCYDPKRDTVKKRWHVKEWKLMGITAVPHINSFVSLKALGERCGSKKKAIERSLEDTEY